MPTPKDARKRLEAVRSRAAALSVEREAAVRRRGEIAGRVGLAKGRLALRPKVDAFLEQLQAEAHARRVGDFERLLTALASEVMPQQTAIRLELEVERGQPSLDIVAAGPGGAAEDVYEDKGGALTNVISMGLRLIAAVRSGSARFLLLDEADCWIRNDRVPAFYSVLKDAAKKLGVQCIAVSHHDVATFGDGIAVAKLTGHPRLKGGTRIENSPRRHEWQDGEEGIRSIRLRNFQGFVDETMYLSPGANAVVGENDVGKSSFVRAFRAVFYGEARDSLIRRGERTCMVEIGLPGGKTLRWDRQARRNPVNRWMLLGPDGAVVTEEGMTFETGGRTVPEWVNRVAGIGPVEGMDVHAGKQKSPVFLLDKPGSTRAAVLSVGRESGHVRKMIQIQKERCAADAALVKEGEAEIARLDGRIAQIPDRDGMDLMVRAAMEALDKAEHEEREAARLEDVLAGLERASAALAKAVAVRAALEDVPEREAFEELYADCAAEARLRGVADALAVARAGLESAEARERALARLPDAVPVLEDVSTLVRIVEEMRHAKDMAAKAVAVVDALAALPEAMPTIVPSDAIIRAGRALRDAKADLARAEARARALEAVPDTMPALEDGGAAAAALAALERAGAELAAARERSAAAEAAFLACEAEIEAAAAETGGACPLCGGEVGNPLAYVGACGHAHGREAADA